MPAGQGRPVRLSAPAVTIAGKTHLIDLSGLYRVPAAESRVIGFLRKHVPGAIGELAHGSSGTMARPTRFVSYFVNRIPDGVATAAVVMSMIPAGAGHTWLRLDAQVL